MIKVAVLKYGVGGVFASSATRNGYVVCLKNGRVINITKDTIKAVNRGNYIVFSRFTNTAKLKKMKVLEAYVFLCYAVMVEYLHQFGFRKRKSLARKEAIEYFQEGYAEGDLFTTDNLFNFLGLKKVRKIESLNEDQLDFLYNDQTFMLYSRAHVVAVCNGYYDNYGTRVKIETGTIPILGDDRAKWWYMVK